MNRQTVHNLFALEAFLAGVCGFAYAVAFIVAQHAFAAALFLALAGLFALKVAVILYGRVRHVQEDIARAALLFASFGALGTLLHGGYDLANTIHPPVSLPTDVPNPVDPRGLLAFGASGLGIFLFSWLLKQEPSFPRALSTWGTVTGVLLVIIYLARLIILSPAHPLLLYPVLLGGFVFGPVWYLWLAQVFRKHVSP